MRHLLLAAMAASVPALLPQGQARAAPAYTFGVAADPNALPNPRIGAVPFGLDGAGQVVGSYTDASGTHGFLHGAAASATTDGPHANGLAEARRLARGA